MATPNMSLTLPVVSSTLGPLWAAELNVALELVDLHDHTSGKGVKVPTAGLNINADLSFAGYAALALKHVGMSTGAIDPAIAGAIYVKNGDLYFTSPSITAVQLTDGTSIKGVAGNISGLGDGGSSAAFNDFTEDFTFKFAADNRFAAFNIGEIRLYPFDGVNEYDYPITIKSPLSLAAAYQIELPGSLPLADNVLSVTSAGVVKQGLGDGTAAAPSLAFASDGDTGIYRIGSNNIGIAVGAINILNISASGLSITGSLTSSSVSSGSIVGTSLSAGTGTITGGATTIASIATTQPSITSSGAWSSSPATLSNQLKVAVITGTVAAGVSDAYIEIASATQIVSCTGMWDTGSNLNWRPITNSDPAGAEVYFSGPSASNAQRKVRIVNELGGTINIRAVVVYY